MTLCFFTVVLALLLARDAFRLRRRAAALVTLPPSDDVVSSRHVFLVRPGVELTETTKRAASAYATAHGLAVVDLVPRTMASWRAIVFLLKVDPSTYRTDRLSQGFSACDAILVDVDVLARARDGGAFPAALATTVDFAVAARVIKRYATTGFDFVIVRDLKSPGMRLRERRRLLRMAFTDLGALMVFLQLGVLALALAKLPVAGLVVLAIHVAQPLIVTLGTPLAPKDRFSYAFTRIAVDVMSSFGPIAAEPTARVADAALRATYASLLRQGTAPFFDAPRSDCALCGTQGQLTKLFDVGDRHQHKPGTFTLVRCASCGHIFQNPRLSIAGLQFYYRDFYDGLGADALESVFASGPAIYRARARMVMSVGSPRRWLDVGAGHGHFCNVAHEVMPDTTFDGLDLNDAIVDAERRGWVGRGIQGLFPSVASSLVHDGGRYDVVSMSHYLEHTVEPRAEIAAAAEVLDEGGLLFIEVPNPESAFAKLLGKRWMPWFQPQHLHLLSRANVERLLREAGFAPIAWDGGEAHQASDFLYLTLVQTESIAPIQDHPWRPAGGMLSRPWRLLVWSAAIPAIAGAWILDQALGTVARTRPSWASAYRVVARKTKPGPPDGGGDPALH